MELKIEKVDDMTFTIFTGKDGDPERAAAVAELPRLPDRPVGPDRHRRGGSTRSTADPALAPPPVGTGPFVFESYAPVTASSSPRTPTTG